MTALMNQTGKCLKSWILHVVPLKPLKTTSNEPTNDQVWYCNSPLGQSTLENMMKIMSKAAEITPHLTNHCVRATSVTVLADNNVEARHIKSVTGHKSTTSIESYNSRSSLRQKENMSNILSRFVSEDTNNSQLAIEYPSTSREIISHSMSPERVAVRQQMENSYQNFQLQAPQAFHFHDCNVSITNNNYTRWTVNPNSRSLLWFLLFPYNVNRPFSCHITEKLAWLCAFF